MGKHRHTQMEVCFQLEAQLQQVAAVYERLTSHELMTQCFQRMTQNWNEHLYSGIRPQHRGASKMMTDLASATPVCNYNVGFIESNLSGLGTKSTLSMEKYLQAKDAATDPQHRRKTRIKAIRRDLECAAGKYWPISSTVNKSAHFSDASFCRNFFFFLSSDPNSNFPSVVKLVGFVLFTNHKKDILGVKASVPFTNNKFHHW